jgi:hypothetical protein
MSKFRILHNRTKEIVPSLHDNRRCYGPRRSVIILSTVRQLSLS